jgi:hypothetical protein
MKKIINNGFVWMLAVILLSNYPSGKASAQGVAVSVNYQTFYDGLSPYGTWIDYPAYGHVWHPTITGEFRPYLTNGYWDYSTEGWTWMSNYDWGWAPFHYGRWVYDDLYGWLWVPGYEWSPAWVTWGMYDNFYAWAPLMPGVNVGIAFDLWRPAAFYWNVVGRDHIYDRDIFNRAEKRDLIINNISRINIINNFSTTKLHGQYYSKGPDVHEVERFTNRKIDAASIREVNKIGVARHEGKEIQVYRPAVNTPQPREFKRVDNNEANPVRSNEDRVSTEREQQNRNIDHLPVRRAPESVFGGRNSGGERRNRRN